MALTIVSRQPSHLAILGVRLRRLTNLLKAGRKGVIARADDLPFGIHLVAILGQIEGLLPEIRSAVIEATDRASERGAFSLELLDLHTWKLASLRAALNLSSRLDRSLVRYMLGWEAFLFLACLSTSGLRSRMDIGSA